MSINYTEDTGYGFVIPKGFFSNYRKVLGGGPGVGMILGFSVG